MMAAFSEGLSVADKAGLSQQTLLEVLASNIILLNPLIAYLHVSLFIRKILWSQGGYEFTYFHEWCKIGK